MWASSSDDEEDTKKKEVIAKEQPPKSKKTIKNNKKANDLSSNNDSLESQVSKLEKLKISTKKMQSTKADNNKLDTLDDRIKVESPIRVEEKRKTISKSPQTVEYLESNTDKEILKARSEITSSALKESRWADDSDDESNSPSKPISKFSPTKQTRSTTIDRTDPFPKGPRNTSENTKRTPSSPNSFRSSRQSEPQDVSKFTQERERNRQKKLSSRQLDWDRDVHSTEENIKSISSPSLRKQKFHSPSAHPPRTPTTPSKPLPPPPKPTPTAEEIRKAEQDIAKVISGGLNWADDLDDF